MLAGFIFLGILAATSLPDMMDLLRDDGDGGTPGADEDGETDQDQQLEQEQSTDPLPDPDPDGDDTQAPDPDTPEPFDPADGEDLFVDPGPGPTEVQSFNPGIDSLTIAVPDEAQEFTLHDAQGDQDAYLGYETAEGSVQIVFSGLDTVPVDDIFLRVSDASSPTLDADIALSQLMNDTGEDTGEDGGEGDILGPVDPTLPDEPGEPVDPDGPALSPVDPELPDDPAPPLDGGGPVLEPVDEDTELSDDTAALATLVQRDGGSTVGLATAPEAGPGGTEGSDSVLLPDDGSGPGTLTVDQAAVNLTADAGAAPLAVDLGAGDDTLSGGDGAAYVFGGPGDDILTAGSGATALFGGADDDLLTGDPEGGPGLLHGGSGDDTLIGGSAGAWLDGGEHGEAPGIAAGDDSIQGGAGNDTIRGGWGADSLAGGAGDDVIDHRGTDAERVVAERHEFAWHIDGAADTLDGGAGNDTLTFDRGDVVTGGAGEDVMWLYADAAAPESLVSEITDFTPGEDFLRISLNPQIAAEGVVEIVVSEDGLDGLVQVDGTTVAILRGAPDATLDDIYVETAEDVFPAG